MLGIGGIGMSALARYFLNKGADVYGYDRTETSLTKQLVREGIDIHYDDNVNFIPEVFKKENLKYDVLIIYTPAIPDDNAEINFFLKNNRKLYKRAEILGEIMNTNHGIAIAGTHGKTSVSTMIAHILKSSGRNCDAFLGGISKNYKTNFLFSENSNYVVAEADEFDKSFLKLLPQIAVITSVDADHLDIYKNKNAVAESFQKFADNIQAGGTLILKQNININNKNIRKYTYSINEKADYYAGNIKIKDGYYVFDVIAPRTTIKNVCLGIPGLFNVENSVAAIAVALQLQVEEDDIRNALANFCGIERRFDYKINDKVVYIDDYAHHPEEIKACINAVRHLFKDKKITGIFQPHLYSRTRDFADDFAKSLETLDELFLLDIYPAREKPVEGVSSKLIFDKVNIKSKKMTTLTSLINDLQHTDIQVLISMGAGNIDTKVNDITKLLTKKYNIQH